MWVKIHTRYWPKPPQAKGKALSYFVVKPQHHGQKPTNKGKPTTQYSTRRPSTLDDDTCDHPPLLLQSKGLPPTPQPHSISIPSSRPLTSSKRAGASNFPSSTSRRHLALSLELQTQLAKYTARLFFDFAYTSSIDLCLHTHLHNGRRQHPVRHTTPPPPRL